MRLFYCLLLGFSLTLFARAEPISIPSLSPSNGEAFIDILNQGIQHHKELDIKKDQLYNRIKKVHGDSQHLYEIAGVHLEDFEAFQSFVLGIFNIYANTVNQDTDFKSPALKLTFDFQRAIKVSHERIRSVSAAQLDVSNKTSPLSSSSSSSLDNDAYAEHHIHNENEDTTDSVKELLHGMLKEVSDNADQLEEEMQQNNLVFSSTHAVIETVLKLEDDRDSEESVATLVDQDNNEYILMRPADTTVIIEDAQLIHDFILVLVSSFLLGWMFTWIGLPAFFGYILAGIMIGPSGYNLIQELIQMETLAQLGVVLIVFVLGLEFSLDKLKKMWRLALGGAVTILLVTVAFFVLMGMILNASTKEVIFVGACVSLSSTAVVVKCIKLDQLDHLYGLLVMQDIILSFMLAVIPAFSKSGTQVFVAFFKSMISFAIFGAVCYTIVRFIPHIPRVIKRIVPIQSIQKNHELMLLATMSICMTLLVVSERLGLGMELGCFAAGVIVRSRKGMFETSLTVIEPVRDLFACLFFASIGLHIYPSFLASEAMLLLTLSGAVIGFKYVATCIILYLFKFDLAKSSTMAVALAQVSEFGFVLASRAKQLGIISREVYYLLLAITSITLVATPLLLKLTNNRPPSSNTHHLHIRRPEDDPSIALTDSEKLA
ncbi:hypothetical protein K501DRAFT_338313 [Backusella circina FSU 941]|nr:hypothetical protein K501DRAFT_338313 [Backusella circina FSU 941]